MVVVVPLLATKLHMPVRRAGVVARPRLRERLDRGSKEGLTLVSAPAGFGKTTVLTEWLASDTAADRAVAWLSLDHRDNDPALFWTYVLAALRSVVPDVAAAGDLLRSAPPGDAFLAILINDISASPREIVLVLDDFHVIDSVEVQEGVAFLLEHMPAQLHLVIAARADPALPLGRLRGRGRLVELRAADLRFTPDEAAAYLTGVMGLSLTAHDLAALDGHTEGWIAALQLAALSMQGRADAAEFIAAFAGDDRYIVDYLVEEVLQRQPERIREFLLRTSILNRLTGPLCDAVTGRADGKAMLESLDRANLFLIPLDDQRRWYRYHHLFADVLRVHLVDELPDAVADLHRRAADWYERNGDRFDAVEHAMAGGAAERAADLIEPTLPVLQQSRQEVTLRRWVEALPDEVLRIRPVLSIAYAGSLMIRGEIRGVEERLRDAERWLPTTPGDRPTGQMVVVDEEAFRRIPGVIALYRAGQALLSGDIDGTMRHGRTVLDLAGDTDVLARGSASGLVAIAHWRRADLVAAYRCWAGAASDLEQAGHLSDVTGCALALADIRLAQGSLDDAMAVYQRSLKVVTLESGATLRGAADMHVGMAGVLVERGDLDGARRHLEADAALGEHAGLPQNAHRRRIVLARIREADGDVDGAIALLDEAERRYVADYFPDVRPIPALRARVHARHGRWADALDWAGRQGISIRDDPDYLREFEHITLARALVARGLAGDAERALGDVERLLQRLQAAAEDGGRAGSMLDVLVVRAIAERARGDMPAAVAALQRALALGVPRGYRRIFLDEHHALADVLTAAAAGDGSGYARRLLDARDTGGDRPAAAGGLIDPLSARELDVLRLLGSDLDGPDIARALFVSVNTVRTHTKNIYAKLGVSNRRAAVRRGGELRLLTRSGDEQPG